MTDVMPRLWRTAGRETMKIGFWNRLAIVAIIVGALVAATANFYSFAEERGEIRQRGYEACLSKVPSEDGSMTVDYCFETWLDDFWMPGWEYWLDYVGLFFVVGIVLYFVMWLGVLIARWVWRGREVSAE